MLYDARGERSWSIHAPNVASGSGPSCLSPSRWRASSRARHAACACEARRRSCAAPLAASCMPSPSRWAGVERAWRSACSGADHDRVRSELIALGATVHAEVCDLRSLDQVRTRRSGTIAFITSIGGKIAVPRHAARRAPAAEGCRAGVEEPTAELSRCWSQRCPSQRRVPRGALPEARSQRRRGAVAEALGRRLTPPEWGPYSSFK